ncbi:glycoside hydrolase family 57 protein [Kutzneria buriramensis]|uniref:1,4-alpha-glucan branching enzyme n=1 Tax=Kutzneria buriramensis TaxID=1045776 RepID=A0A3E0HAQ6_9PSEU|nr:glycoside hydrolase family 57 protein [Kutzneria buriramensis]REH41126.1 1,4-alpha-glucan branching enzyme [Kutzneria buriramensis]
MTEEGTFCLVVHSHLPWLAHHGSWPVGEEWLHQAWAHSYLPVVELLERYAAQGKRDVLTLGVTPVLAAQLDDPYCLRAFHDWLGNWQLRADFAATRWTDPLLKDLAASEHRASAKALNTFETQWRHGFSPVLRRLVDGGVIELLGGPATHPFQPLLDDRIRRFALNTGLADTEHRIGTRPQGIWAPECGYSPGMERDYAAAGVQRFLVDGPALHGDTAAAHTVGDSDVVCFGRDLEVTYRVWSPKAGYPGDPAYRDFHTYDHPSGLKPSRVTGKHVPPEQKRPYEPELAAVAVQRHAADFVDTVVRRLRSLPKPGLVVAAYDTELFGHWWHEGPAWLDAVLTALPEAGVRVTTLRGALEAGHLGGPVDLPASSWGSGKDWRVWDGEQVADMVADNAKLQRALLETLRPTDVRDPAADQMVREALLALSSDWAFMVTKDSAADYARHRASVHAGRFSHLADLIRIGATEKALDVAGELRKHDGLFGTLDARGC